MGENLVEDGVDMELEKKMQVLEGISSEIEKVYFKLERFKTKKQHALEQITADKWLQTYVNRKLRSFDVSFAKRTRTYVGLCGEELMRILFKLDQVQSEGKEKIRNKRRQLVTRINNELLPMADKYLVEAQAVVTLQNKLRRLIKQKKASNEDMEEDTDDVHEYILPENDSKQTMDSDIEERTSESVNVESEVQTEEHQAASVVNDDDKIEEAGNNEKRSDDESNSESELESESVASASSMVRLKPDYRLKQTEDAALIKILLPSNEIADDLKFQLRGYDDELLVIGKSFELPFKVNSNSYLLDEAQVRVVTDEEVIIIIPKKRYSPYSRDYSYMSNPYQRNPYSNYYRTPEEQRYRRSPYRRQEVPYHGYSPFFDNSFFGRSFF